MKKIIIYSILILIAFFLLSQLIPVHRPAVLPHSANSDFMIAASPPAKLGQDIQNACYDCHSFKTVYPWYSKVAPVSWFIMDHVREARRKVNFSLWDQYTSERKAKLLKKCAREIRKGDMPIAGYPMMHKKARLTKVEKDSLEQWLVSAAQKDMGIVPK